VPQAWFVHPTFPASGLATTWVLAEQLQHRSARMVSTSRRVVVLIVIAVQGAAGVRILAAVPHISGPRMIDAEALEVRARLAFE